MLHALPRERPASPARRRLAAAALLLAAVGSNAWLLAGALGSPLPAPDSLVGELGARDQPGSQVLQLSASVTGALCAAAALLAAPLLPRTPWLVTARRALLVAGAGTIAAGVLPLECAVTADATCRTLVAAGAVAWQHHAHVVASALAVAASAVVALGLGLGTRRVPGWLARSRAWLTASAVLAASIVGIVVGYPGPAAGIGQRVGIVTWSAVLVLAGISLAQLPAAPQPPPMPAVPTRMERLPDGTEVRIGVHNPGAATAAVFSAGLGLPLESWHPVLAHLPGVTAVLADRPGLAGSPPWPRPPAGLADQSRLVASVLALTRESGEVAPDATVVLVGHSYGATLMEATARMHPGLAAALVLVDPSDPQAEAGTVPPDWQRRIATWWSAGPRRAAASGRVALWLVGAVGTARIDAVPMPATMRRWFTTPRHLRGTLDELCRIGAESAELLDLARATTLGPDVQLLAARWRGWPTYATNRRWLLDTAQRAARLGASLHPVPAAHLVSMDDPAAVAELILAVSRRRP